MQVIPKREGEEHVITLGDLTQPIDCTAVKFTSNGKTTTVWHLCNNPKCPRK